MYKQKTKQFHPTLATAIAVMGFYLGNRIVYLCQLYSVDYDSVSAIGMALGNLIPSFLLQQQGLVIDFSLTALASGLLSLIIGEAIYLGYLTKRENYKVGEEHGSAKYGTIEEAAKLKDDVPEKNMILSENILLSMDTRKTFLNNNVIVIGGSGSGKTRYFVKPNALQFNSNYIFTDPKGTLILEQGQAFLDQGYDIKVLDLNSLSNTMCYNPFHYCKNAVDVMKFLNNLMTNTKDKESKGEDPFWDQAGLALLMALSFLILGTGYPEDKTIPRLLDLITMVEASEEDENAMSVIDIVFEQLQEEVDAKLQSGDPKLVLSCKNSYEYLACRQYTLYKKAAGKTAKSILITLSVRFSIFNLPQVNEMLSKDELHLETFGQPKIVPGKGNLSDDDPDKYQKSVLFICISDSDSTFSFIAAILYQQLFDLLYRQADINGGRLPIHTRAILDEFANIGKIPDFDRKIATMRSREISVMILLQNLSQLKSMYKDDVWESIYGNCDTMIFLGGKEFSTLEYVSKNIGNTTIDYLSIQESPFFSSNGSWNRSNQLIQRALLAPDEIRRMKKWECLVDIRGEYIFRDRKYDIKNHPNYRMTGDCDQAKMFHPGKYIDEKRAKGELDTTWEMDLSNYYNGWDEKEIIDFPWDSISAYEGDVA